MSAVLPKYRYGNPERIAIADETAEQRRQAERSIPCTGCEHLIDGWGLRMCNLFRGRRGEKMWRCDNYNQGGGGT